MSFAWQDIRYGWKALAGIVLTGATIYVVATTRQRVTQADIVEIVLGTYERCLATQYGTNGAGEALYYVSPSNFVRAWVTTNEAGGWATNAVTNAIGWRSDRAMLAACDALIKACVPYYADTGTLEALTVTGLWASLGIGDGTNLFTREPEWVGTNGVTNAATYGEYPYRVYKTDLEERYKVLEALKATHSKVHSVFRWAWESTRHYESHTNWSELKTRLEEKFALHQGHHGYGTHSNRLSRTWSQEYFSEGSYGVFTYGERLEDFYYGDVDAFDIFELSVGHAYPGDYDFREATVCTQILHRVLYYGKAGTDPFYPAGPLVEFDGYGQVTQGWNLVGSVNWTYSSSMKAACSYGIDVDSDFPYWCAEPTRANTSARGYRFEDDHASIIWAFTYATNKYW